MYAGYLNSDGKCNGAAYSDPFGTWESVVVQGTLKITLSQHVARVKLSNNKIHLRSGTVCTLSDTNCMDQEGGYTFWTPLPRDTCNFNQYGVLFEGIANKLIDEHSSDDRQTIFSLTTEDITFALATKGTESVCGYTVIKTEHPKLLIFELSVTGDSFARKNKLDVSNLDIFAYVNAKFVYVEKHIRSQIKLLYRDILTQRCALERQNLKNALSIATQAPDEFAYDLMKGPGYMAVAAGEVVHIIKCLPVEVRIERGDNCYAELQVSRNNKTFYMTPRTHVLKTQGTQILCNSILPAYYLVENDWYKILPRPTEALPPAVIKPMTRPTWKYINPSEHFAKTGIYTEKDLEQLRETIMFPIERSSMLNDLAREMAGHTLSDSDGTIVKLLNEGAMKAIINNTWAKLWSRFMTFGTASAAIIAILMIVHIVKSIVNIILRGYALHKVYGWSLHLLGAIWSTFTHLLLYLSGRPNDNGQQREPVNVIDVKMNDQEPVAGSSKSNQVAKRDEKQPEEPGYFSLGIRT